MLAKEFYNHYHKMPTIHDLGAFFPLYLKCDLKELEKNNLSTNFGGDNEQEISESFLNSEPFYSSFDDFCVILFKDDEGEL